MMIEVRESADCAAAARSIADGTCRPRRTVGLPGKPMIDREGLPLRDESIGKLRYIGFAAFDDMELLWRFSDAAVSALDADYPAWRD